MSIDSWGLRVNQRLRTFCETAFKSDSAVGAVNTMSLRYMVSGHKPARVAPVGGLLNGLSLFFEWHGFRFCFVWMRNCVDYESVAALEEWSCLQ